MKSFIKSSALVACLLIATACGNNGGNGGGGGDAASAPQESCDKRSPQYEGEGVYLCYVMSTSTNGQSCTTGKREFTSMSSYCSGLLNDQLNNNCARDRRVQTYSDARCN